MRYRAEIDGLRALAVIPVILFHAGFKPFSGGFVGVDVFFVISGYLITTIILSEMEEGTFSLLNFYERRFRRILPPLFLVMLVSLPFAWLLLFPSDMKDFSESLVAVSIFSSNILFWRETGYWDTVNELKPLLHTWSLAVEEQYYVLFPLFLLLMWRFRKRWIFGSFVTIATVSLAISQWGAYNKPSATFFLLPTRGWELAIGAGIAFYSLYRKRDIRTSLFHKSIDEIFGLVGLLMIGYSVYVFDENVPFPSVFALIPTLGAGLVIFFASSQTIAGRFLGSKLLVGIGLISYSAYLWHQPIFAFARHRALTEPDKQLFAILAVLSFLLAFLSWKYIERPFRDKQKISKKAIFIFAMTGSIAFIALGMAGRLTNGFGYRSTKSGVTIQSIEEKTEVNHGLSKTCEGSFTLSTDCRTSAEPEILIWGDSFAMHLVQGIMASKPDAKIIQMTKSSCGPFFDVSRVTEPKYPVSWAKGCLEFTGQVREWLKENKSVRYVVLSSPFDSYISNNNSLLFRNGDIVEASMDLAMIEFKKTLNELESMGIIPVVFSPPPTNGTNLGRCLTRAEWNGLDPDDCNFQRGEIIEDQSYVNNFLESIGKRYRVIGLDNLICDNSVCKTNIGSIFVYRDDLHLSKEGSALLGKKYSFYKIVTESFTDNVSGRLGVNFEHPTPAASVVPIARQ
ncbi:MAG: acyltransferase family protein [Desulfoprunum sp.]